MRSEFWSYAGSHKVHKVVQCFTHTEQERRRDVRHSKSYHIIYIAPVVGITAMSSYE